MTGTPDKLRSLFLAGLMVVSVFAGTVALAGTAAATVTNPTLSPDTVAPGQEPVQFDHNATVKTQSSGNSTLDTVEVDLDDANLENVSTNDFRLEINGSVYGGNFDQFTTSSGVLTADLSNNQNVTPSDRVNVSVGFVKAPVQEGTYTARTKLLNPNGNTIDSWSNTYDVDADAEVDQDPPFEKFDDYDANFTSDEVRWVGQRLKFVNDTADGTNFVFGIGTDTSDDGTSDERANVEKQLSFVDSRTIISTSNLDGGNNYVISVNGSNTLVDVDSTGNKTGANNETLASDGDEEGIELVEQTLDANIKSDRVPRQSQFEVDFTSQRANYLVTVDSPSLSDDQLADIFGADASPDTLQASYDGHQIRIDSGDDTITATADMPRGDYDFTFDVADTTASDTDNLTVGAPEDREVTLVDRIIEDERGDVASIELELDNTQEGAVVVGGDDVSYQTTVSFRDTDEDGEVTLDMNTFEAGKRSETFEENPGNVYSVGDGDDIVGIDRSDGTPSELEAADYQISAQVSGTETDVGTLILHERGMEEVNVLTAPDRTSFGDIPDDESMDKTIAQDDWAIVRFNATGLEGWFEDLTYDQNGTNASLGATVKVESAGQVNEPGSAFSANDGFVTLDHDLDNDTFDVVLETEELDPGQYEATFELNESNPYVEDTGPGEQEENLTTTFRIVERQASFDTQDGEVVVRSDSGQAISGTTNIAENSEIQVRARRSAGDIAFLKTNTTVVDADGNFEATLDFSDVPENTTFTASIPNAGFRDNVETPGRVRPRPEASVSISDQTSDGTRVVVDSVELSDGGFVTIHDDSLNDGAVFDSVRGSSRFLPAGSHTDITVTLDSPYESSGTVIPMPHLDTNGNQAYDFVSSNGAEDGPYTDDQGNPVTDSAQLTIPTPTATDTPDQGTPTESPTPTDTPTESPTPTPEQPGFGVIVAILALLGAALIAARRR